MAPGSLPCEVCGKWCKNRGALIKHRSLLHRPLLSPPEPPAPAPPALVMAPHFRGPAPPPPLVEPGEVDPLAGLGAELQRVYHQFM